MNKESFDDIIKKYTEALELMGKTYGGEAEEMVEKPLKSENEGISEGATTDLQEAENIENESEKVQITIENEEDETESDRINTEPAVNDSATDPAQSEVTSSASFSAVIFSGEGAYPVEGARIVIYRDDNIYAFLQSDANGRTESVELPAFEEENSLQPDNPDRSIDYFADVFAEGFISQKGLLVSSVGGSEILLRVLMVPEEERIG